MGQQNSANSSQSPNCTATTHRSGTIGAEGLSKEIFALFARVRFGIKEHLESGQMNGNEFGIYMILLLYANIKTGIAEKLSAPFIANMLRTKVSIIDRILRSLEKKKYIRRIFHRGHRGSYPIIINKYITADGLKIKALESIFDNHISLWDNKLAFTVKDDCSLIAGCSQFDCRMNEVCLLTIRDIKRIERVKITKKKENKAPTEKSDLNSTFPDNFQVTDKIRAWAKEKGFRKPDLLFEEFRDHHLKKGSRFKDWEAAFRTWIRNDLKYNPREEKGCVINADTPEGMSLLDQMNDPNPSPRL